MKRIRIKICGITSSEDARLAASAGADAIGLVFWEGSPRAVDPERARQICDGLPPLLGLIGVFLNPPPLLVKRVLDYIPLTSLQFHGTESPQQCRELSAGRPYIKALSASTLALDEQSGQYHSAAALLIDSHLPNRGGGTGSVFDWQQLAEHSRMPLILAGGLNADNVSVALQQSGALAVDVSSGVEQYPGKKHRQRLLSFISAVRQVELA